MDQLPAGAIPAALARIAAATSQADPVGTGAPDTENHQLAWTARDSAEATGAPGASFTITLTTPADPTASTLTVTVATACTRKVDDKLQVDFG
ncbi:hypothetical protein ACFQVC_31265 [Streptomyces monticola]|uniref:Flagellar hook-length control protein FliK n=1 Tax=Streptomyces monticola TaxID=2666263 RepID=A0ABW2JSP5_9ACTN